MSVAAQCPSCGAPIAFHVASSVVTVCEHCSTAVARTDRSIEALGRCSDLVQTRSPLTLWLGGHYRGVGFQLTGRAQIRHGMGGIWDEWYMAFDDGRWGWLAEAQGRFFLTFRQPTAGPIDPRTVVPGNRIQVGHPPVVVTVAETGEAELLAGRGEIPYRLQPGHRYGYADLGGASGEVGTLDFGEQPPALYLGHEITLDQLGISRQAPAQDPQYGAGAIAAEPVSVQGVTCENCGGSLELHAPGRSERVACPYCGAMHDCDRGILRFLAEGRKPSVEPAIPLGSQGQFEGETFTVIGFVVRATSSGWETFQWCEYLLYNGRLGFRWLAESDGHWNYLTPVPIGEVQARRPDDSHYRGEEAEYGDTTYKIFQAGRAKVRYVAGEFYWKVEAEQVSYTADYVEPPRMLSGDATDNEINWSLGVYMTHRELAAHFPGVDIARIRRTGVAPNQPFRHKGVYLVWLGALVVAVALLFWARSSHRATTAFKQTFDLPAQEQADRAKNQAQVLFSEPFELADNQNIEVTAYGPQVSNSWMFVEGDLYAEKTGLVVPFDVPIEYYSGTEFGEYWDEGSRISTKYLSSVPAGTYILRVGVERSDWRKPSKLQVRLEQGVFRLRYWLLALLGLSLVPLGVLFSHLRFEARRWENSDFSGGDE